MATNKTTNNMIRKMHVFDLVISEGETVSKKIWIGSSVRDCKNRLTAKQEIVRIKKVDDNYSISLDKLRDTLSKANYGETETAMIMSAVREMLPHIQ